MVYITGDVHIPSDIQKLSTKRFPEQKNLTKNDYVIICGDFGGVWDDSNEEHYWRKWLENKNFTTLFVDGNHENFTMLNEFPEVDFCGAKAHKISESIFHLMRGQVFELENQTFFTLGGASSHDKDIRTLGKNWWKEELPSQEDYQNATKALDHRDWQIDYIVTHCAPTSVQQTLAPNYEENELTQFLEEIKGKTKYQSWFFGHYHQDKFVDKQHIAVFNSILQL